MSSEKQLPYVSSLFARPGKRQTPGVRGRGRRAWPFVLGGVALAALLVRLMLPGLVLRRVNGKLAALEGYDGRVEGISLGVWMRSPVVNIVKGLKQTLTGVEMTKLNDFFQAYAKVKVKSGVFGLYAEAAGKEGRFVGYAKPFLKDVVVDKKAGVWDAVVGIVRNAYVRALSPSFEGLKPEDAGKGGKP